MIDKILPYAVGTFMVVMVVLLTYVRWDKVRRDKVRIREILAEKGYANISVSYRWRDFDKSNNTYDVECRGPQGRRLSTTCKIHGAPSFDEDIYWKDVV